MKKILKFSLLLLPCLLYSADFNSKYYFDEFGTYVLTPEDLIHMRHSYVVQKLNQIDSTSSAIQLQKIGESVRGRSLNMLSYGKGKTKLLLWSQMHGDEPTATAALLAIFNFFSQNEKDTFVQDLYDKLSIHAIIMLNPDGAQSFRRRNEQDIDINRDARMLQSPEAQALKGMQEKIKPHYGFNLHDMRGREMVGDSKKLLNIALMAPPFDKDNSDSPNRIRAKKLVTVIKTTLDPFISGHVARYKADYMPRAFGDAMQNWGVSTILMESGLHDDEDPRFLVKLNFVALLSAFHAIASGEIEQADENIYEQIPLEGSQLFDLLIKNARVYNGTDIPAFIADIGINIERELQDEEIIETGKISDIGDLSISDGIEVIEGTDLALCPGFIVRKANHGVAENRLATTLVTDQPHHTDIREYLFSTTKENLPKIPFIPENNGMDVNKIPVYTSDPARFLNITAAGLVKREMQADLLIFSHTQGSRLLFENLLYVIKNGKIIYPEKAE